MRPIRKSPEVRKNRPANNCRVEPLERRVLYSAANVHAAPGFTLPIVAPPAIASARRQSLSSHTTIDGTPIGYTPSQLRTAYGVNGISFGGVAGDGSGKTIAIVIWGDDPDMVSSTSPLFNESDLHQFDLAMGLADPPSFMKVDETGGSNYPSTAFGTSTEISLDVEWSHAMAPGANIVLVEAADNYDASLFGKAMNYARHLPSVSVISMSFGAPDGSYETVNDPYFTTPNGHQGITFVASSGDFGNIPEYPATSPNVVSVGGTSLYLNSNNSYQSESGWSGSGGGVSAAEAQPAYQKGYVSKYSTSFRTSPDISLDADPNTGVAVLDSFDYGGWAPGQIGGTSLSAPATAGLFAIVNQGRALEGKGTLPGLSGTLPALYRLSKSSPGDFNDITTGNNGSAAQRGYDLVTGIGTPVANLLVPDLVAVGPVTAPTNLHTTSVNATSVGLAFNGPLASGITYRVADSLNGGATWTHIGDASGTTYLATGLPQEARVLFKVRAAQANAYSAYSNTVSVTLPTPQPTPTPVPTAPTNLQVTSVSDNSVNLAFDAPIVSGIVYRVADSLDGGATWTHLGDTPNDTYVAIGFSPGTNVSFEVRAANGTIYSAYSNVVNVTLPTPPPPPPPTPTPTPDPTPAAPSDLVAARDDSLPGLNVVLTWINNDRIASVNIARSTDGVNFTHLATVSPGVNRFTDTSGLRSGKEYYYEIRSFVVESGQTYFSSYSNIDPAIPR